jgi:hypothetical protein
VAQQNSNPPATGEKKAKFKVTLANSGFKGERFGVTFVDGVGETDDGKKAHACVNEIPGSKATKDGKEWPEPEKPEADPSKK